MTLRMVFFLFCAALPSVARAQSANPQSAPSPWSFHDAIGAPDNLKLRASVRNHPA